MHPSRRCRDLAAAVIEVLERRQLLSGDPHLSASAAALSVAINFQPGSASVPSGLLVDAGYSFGSRGNGFTYGWNGDNTSHARDRNSSLSADQRYDTLNHMQKEGNRTWEIALPNGSYTVRLVAGDPDYYDSVYRIELEGVLAINATPSSGTRWFEATRTVTVNDGRLTISNSSGASNNKISFVEIASEEAPQPPPSGSTSFSGVIPVPGLIEAENFDNGGQGVSFWDTDSANLGGKYRSTPVDIVSTGDSGGGYALAYTRPGEWLQYSVNVAETGLYTIELRVASGSSGGKLHLDFNGVNKTGSISFNGTGGWNNWRTITVNDVSLNAGQQFMRLVFDSANSSSNIGDINWIKLTKVAQEPPPPPPPSGSTPYAGVIQLPGLLQMENFDNGGQGVSFWDTDSANQGGQYRSTPVDIVSTSDSGGGYAIGFTRAGEWLQYTVNIAQSGLYNLEFRVASGSNGGKFRVLFGGVDKTGLINISNTGGWGKWTTISKSGVSLSAGQQFMRIVFDSANSSGQTIVDMNWVRISAVPTSGPGLFQWTAAASSPIPRVEAQGVAVNGKLYVFGGFVNSSYVTTTRSDAYDPASNSWTRIADLPQLLTHAAVATSGNDIYFVGGYAGTYPGPVTAEVWKYSTVSNSFTAMPALPFARGAGAAAVVNNRLHFFGGMYRNSAGDYFDAGNHWVLDLSNPGAGWQSAASMPNPRNHLAAATVSGKIYAIGGQYLRDEYSGNQSSVHVYNPASNSWSAVASLPWGLGHFASGAYVDDGRIFVTGGTKNGDIPANELLAYDPASNTWVLMGTLPAGRKSVVAGSINGQLISATGGNPHATSEVWRAHLPGTWQTAATMPVRLGEVAVGIIGNKLYAVGDGSNRTLAYNLSTGTWQDNLAVRPYVAKDHIAQVYNGRLYLFGGVYYTSSQQILNKVQIYNPATNSWSLGADMPFPALASQVAMINGQIYLAGGVTTGNVSTTKLARYNPANNTWTMLADMPVARNSGATGTDGSKMYIFGGRGPGSGDGDAPGNGFADVLVYNPANNTWTASFMSGSNLAPLPQARGGIASAPFVNGEFYVIGGETVTGAGATPDRVYNRVDIYNPLTNTWRLGNPMPTARHGIMPIAHAGRIYVAGGGIVSGKSESNILEILNVL